jgi:hypothetical protein
MSTLRQAAEDYLAIRRSLGFQLARRGVPAAQLRRLRRAGRRIPASTYWYLEATPELLALAAARQQRVLDGLGGTR